MIKFFRPDDFPCSGLQPLTRESVAEFANAKLEYEGKVVYGQDGPNKAFATFKFGSDTHKALLVCIEPIEVCKHPKEKISESEVHNPKDGSLYAIEYICQCGTRVRPTLFEEV